MQFCRACFALQNSLFFSCMGNQKKCFIRLTRSRPSITNRQKTELFDFFTFRRYSIIFERSLGTNVIFSQKLSISILYLAPLKIRKKVKDIEEKSLCNIPALPISDVFPRQYLQGFRQFIENHTLEVSLIFIMTIE